MIAFVAGCKPYSACDAAQDKHTQVTTDVVVWQDNPAFPKGVQVATLVGDQTKAGDTVVLRIKFPANFQMPPHTHPYSEVVTIISGAIGTSQGEKFEKKGELLKPQCGCIRQNTRITHGPATKKRFNIQKLDELSDDNKKSAPR